MNARNPGERRGRSPRDTGLVLLSLLTATTFDLISLGSTVDALRPDLALLVLLYWSTRAHSPANVGIGWAIGLLRDIGTLAPLGLNAGLYCLSAWLGMGLRQRLDAMPLPGELLLVLLILLSGSLLSWGVSSIAGGPAAVLQSHLVAPLVGTLVWPSLRFVLNRLLARGDKTSGDD